GSSLSGPQDPIILPELPGREVHHECELAIIIGKEARHVGADQALAYVFGYACLIDVTVRGKEDRVMRKSYDTFTPIGPAIVTSDEVGDPSSLELKLWVNDELRQHANTRDLILNVPNMVAMASSVTTLYPGDVLASGTPAGVGPIRAGDRVTIEIERVGRMCIGVKQGSGGCNQAIHGEALR
ncbi:MAG: fumarylacetoacetate hydrolase family protein, partial [Candidatus Acidiferrales bacterium]